VSQQLLPPTPSISRHAIAAFYVAGPGALDSTAPSSKRLVIERIGMSGDAFDPLLDNHPDINHPSTDALVGAVLAAAHPRNRAVIIAAVVPDLCVAVEWVNSEALTAVAGQARPTSWTVFARPCLLSRGSASGHRLEVAAVRLSHVPWYRPLGQATLKVFEGFRVTGNDGDGSHQGKRCSYLLGRHRRGQWC
jgi:hypothetical protein